MKGWKIEAAYLDGAGALVVEVPAFGEECVVYPNWIECDGKVYGVDEKLEEVLANPEHFVLREWRDNQYHYHYYLFRVFGGDARW